MLLATIASARRRPAAIHGVAPGFSSWRYYLTTLGDATDYSGIVVDDSAWPVAASPFGNILTNPGVGVSAHAFDARLSALMATTVALDHRLWIRRDLTLGGVPSGGFRLVGYFDNYYQFFINGVLASHGETDANAGVSAVIDASYFVAGHNVIAVRCDDDAATGVTDASYFDFLLDPVY